MTTHSQTIRSQRTEKNIQQALRDLLPNQPYETITMSDIARQASCHRTTVHRHYTDKDNLLIACFETTMETIKETVTYPEEMSDKSTSQAAYANLLAFYRHVANNRTLYQALFTTPSGSNIRMRFRRVVAGIILNIMTQGGTLETVPISSSVIGNLTADIVLGGIIWWLESNSTMDVALLAEVILRLTETGFFGLTGQPVTKGDISFTPFPANWGEFYQ